MSFEPKIDDAVQTFQPPEAFEWLLRQFRDYTHGKLVWIELRSVFLNADALLAKWHKPPKPPKYIHHQIGFQPHVIPTLEMAADALGLLMDQLDAEFGIQLMDEANTHMVRQKNEVWQPDPDSEQS